MRNRKRHTNKRNKNCGLTEGGTFLYPHTDDCRSRTEYDNGLSSVNMIARRLAVHIIDKITTLQIIDRVLTHSVGRRRSTTSTWTSGRCRRSSNRAAVQMDRVTEWWQLTLCW